MNARMTFKGPRTGRLTERELNRHNAEFHGFRPHWHQRGHTPISLHVRLRFGLALAVAVLLWVATR